MKVFGRGKMLKGEKKKQDIEALQAETSKVPMSLKEARELRRKMQEAEDAGRKSRDEKS